ncbi:MAG TPA: Ig-like domain-containing protein [Gemmatimonadaceae bacterium]|jgi:hypothetical protein
MALTTAAIALGCASASQPPGGPERHAPAEILSISPESGQTNVKIREVEFKFDEVVSEQPSGGATDLNQLFLVSPQDGFPNVSWHRSRITIRPRKGFRPNTAYRITMLPGLADLRGNVRKEGASILFSTGPTFPPFGIVGRAFDWAQERPVNGAFIEAISKADTTLIYVTASDSSGMFDLGPLEKGTYIVRGLVDQNSNRIVDPREKWDSTTIEVVDSRPTTELDLIERDSVPPNLINTIAEDSTTLRLTFDKAITPTTNLQTNLFRVLRADSTPLTIDRVEWVAAYNRSKATADSLKRIADSTSRADSLRRTDTTRRAAPPPPPPSVATIAGLRQTRAAPAPPKPRVPAPDLGVVLHLSPATPLTPGRYAVFVHGLANLRGNASEFRRIFVVSPPAPRDTTRRAPGDTTRRPPAVPPRRPPPRR